MYLAPTRANPTPSAQQLWDPPHLMRIARRRLRLMGAILLIVLGVTVVVTLTTPPTYTSEALLLVEKPNEGLISKDRPKTEGGALEASILETEVEVLRSPAVAEAVVRDLALDRDPEFNPALAPPSLKARILAALPHAGASEPPRKGGATLGPVADSVLGGLNVRRVGTSHMINVAYTSHDPDMAMRIANAFVSNYLKSKLEAKLGASREGNAWLNSRIGEMRERVLAAETALQRYKIDNNLLSSQGATLVEQEISTLDQQVALSRAQQAESAARLDTAMRQLASGSSGDDVGESLTSPVVQQLRQQRAVTSQKVANLQSRYGDRHPDLLKGKDELADIDRQIETEIKRIVSNLQAQHNIATERARSIEASASRSRASLVQNNRSIVRLNELQRNADAERTLYESFLSKLKEMTAEAGLARSDAHVVSAARAPQGPSAPRKSLNLAFGVMLGLTLAIGAALVVEVFERGVTDAKVVENELNVPYLGSIPNLSSVARGDPLRHLPVDYLTANPVSSFAESFRSLNAAIGLSRPDAKCRVIAVTSSLPGEGKTTTALGLAQSAAMSGLRTVVIDCDLRRRGGSRVMRMSATRGLVQLLKGEISLEEALIHDAATGMWMLPVAKPHYTPEDMFNSDAMARLMEQLRRRFDLVVLDSAPLILVTEARTVVRYADMVVLLTHWRKTRRSLVRTSLRLLDAAGAHVSGVALTRVDLRQAASVDPDDPAAYYLAYRNYYAPETMALPRIKRLSGPLTRS